MLAKIKELAPPYLKGYPGMDDTPEGHPHAGLEQLLNDSSWQSDTKSLAEAMRFLTFRYSQMTATDYYIRYLNLKPPSDQACVDYNPEEVRYSLGEDIYRQYWSAIGPWVNSILPQSRCSSVEGRNFEKPLHYLIATFDWNGVTPADAGTRMLELYRMFKKKRDEYLEYVRTDPAFSEKRKKAMDAFGIEEY